MRWLGLDVGTKTIGLAVSDDDGRVATPLRTLSRSGGDKDIDALARVVEEFQVGGVVIGLPLGLDGTEGLAVHRVRALGTRLAQRLGLGVAYWDERFSTVEAERALISANVSRQRRKRVVDQAAAVLILQGYLDRQRAGQPEVEEGD